MLANVIEEIADGINQNTDKIVKLQKALELSETGRLTAENMASQVIKSADVKIREAYEAGYQAGASSVNPEGGTTKANETDKTLVLSPQN